MNILLWVFAAVLVWLGVDALLLSKHSLPLTRMQKDELMFGKGHVRPISEQSRSYAESRYPFATEDTMQFLGWLFIAIGLFAAWIAWDM